MTWVDNSLYSLKGMVQRRKSVKDSSACIFSMAFNFCEKLIPFKYARSGFTFFVTYNFLSANSGLSLAFSNELNEGEKLFRD